jgi:hypothetical protein
MIWMIPPMVIIAILVPTSAPVLRNTLNTATESNHFNLLRVVAAISNSSVIHPEK